MIISILIVVEQLTGRDHVLNHLSIPAACFTHPEISMVGLTEVFHVFHFLRILSAKLKFSCPFYSRIDLSLGFPSNFGY